MADHRKFFRPRRPGLDRRFLRRGRLSVTLTILAVLAATPAISQELGLKHGQTSLDSGKYENAVRQFSATVNDRRSSEAQVAQALYLRGVAYRRLGQPARAISDLGAAVWLGLPASEKARALVNKGLAYRAAGLSSQAEAAIAQARRTSSRVDQILAEESRTAVASIDSSPVSSGSVGGSVWDRIVPSVPSFGSSSSDSASAPASAPAPQAAPQSAPAGTRTAAAPSSGWGAEVQDETASQGSAVGRWFGSLTGGSAPTPSSTPGATAPISGPAAPTASRTTTASRTATSPRTTTPPPSADSWAANTSTQTEGEGGTAVGRWFSRQTTSAPAPAQPATAPRGAGYTVQLANSSSPSDAQALWKKAKASNPQLASANPRIEKVEIGSFGTFYTVKIGPYPTSSEGTKVCNALKRRGTDCSVVAPDGP